jgi:hypothetical protein
MEKLMSVHGLKNLLKNDNAFIDREIIDKLRISHAVNLNDFDSQRPTISRVTTIVDDLLKGVSLEVTASKMGLANREMNVNLVLSVIARYGTWLTHTLEVNEIDPVYAIDFVGKKIPKNLIVIPTGYEPFNNNGRDIARALAAIIANKPSLEISARFVDRTYRMRSSSLTYPMVSCVWGFAARNRLYRISKVSSDPIFHGEVVAAYDLLDIARQDAYNAILNVVSVSYPLDKDSISNIRDWLLLASWVHEGEISRLLRVAETALVRPASIPLLMREIDMLKTRVNDPSSHWSLSSIGVLNAGQVRRICSIGGLTVDPPNNSNEASIRATLRSMGLSADADKLVPEALRATEKNMLDEFWSVLECRIEGDVTWSVQLEELLS